MSDMSKYKHGYCYPWALFLAEKYDLNIVFLVATLKNNKIKHNTHEHIVHVCVELNNGDLFDIEKTSREKILEEYMTERDIKSRNVIHHEFKTVAKEKFISEIEATIPKMVLFHNYGYKKYETEEDFESNIKKEIKFMREFMNEILIEIKKEKSDFEIPEINDNFKL